MLADGAAAAAAATTAAKTTTIDAMVEPAKRPTPQQQHKIGEDRSIDSSSSMENGRREGGTAASASAMAKAKARAEAALRAARLVWTAAVISADYVAFDVSRVRVYHHVDD